MRRIIKLGMILLIPFISGCSNKQNRYTAPERVLDRTYVHKYGVEVPRDDWQTRGKDGRVISTLENGITVTQNYSSGILHGETTYTYPYATAVAKMECYDHGRLVKETTYVQAGSPKQEVVYGPDNLRKVTVWYETGAPESLESYNGDRLVSGEYYSPANTLDSRVVDGSGVCINRDGYGLLISHDTFENGKKVKSTKFYSNGTPSEINPLKDGVVDGIRLTFHPGGEPKTHEEWVGGKQHGITIVYENGEKYAEVPYRNGVKHGIELHYAEGSQVVEEIGWLDNNKHGPCRSYVADVVKTDWYYKGQKITKTNYEKMKDKK